MGFTGYIELRQRVAYPRLGALPDFIKQACRHQTWPFVGEFEVVRDHGKLHTTENHLNDHVLHIRCTTAQDQKDILFTCGITDYDPKKGKRVPGNAHAYVQTSEARSKISVAVAERSLDLWAASGARRLAALPPKPSRPVPGSDLQSVAVAGFDGATWKKLHPLQPDDDYLSFAIGDTVIPLGALSEGWARGSVGGCTGWYPPSFVQVRGPAS